MGQPVDALFDLNKYPKVGNAFDFALDMAANRMVLTDQFPGIRGHLLEAERNPAVFRTHVQHNHIDFFPNRQQLRRMGDPFGP